MLSSQRMLIAQSDWKYRVTLESRYSKQGYDVTTVDNGVRCLLELRDRIPDVLLLDRKLLWGGAAGVLAVMNDDAMLQSVAVVLTGDAQDSSAPKR